MEPCELCDQPFMADAPPVETTWGPMYPECADSHDSAAWQPRRGGDRWRA